MSDVGDDAYMDACAGTLRRVAERFIETRRRRQSVIGVVVAVLLLPAGGALAAQTWSQPVVQIVVADSSDSLSVEVPRGADPVQVMADLNSLFRDRGWNIEVRATTAPEAYLGMLVSESAIRRDVEPAVPFTRSITVDADTAEVRVVTAAEPDEAYGVLGPLGEDRCALVGRPGVEVASALSGQGISVTWQDITGAPIDVDERPVVRLVEIGPDHYLVVLDAETEPVTCS